MLKYTALPGQCDTLADPGAIRAQCGSLHEMLVAAPFDFYVSGSHHFGVAHALSDVDLYAALGDMGVIVWLAHHGFYEMGSPRVAKDALDYPGLLGKPSPNTHSVWQHRQLPVQVQVLEDVQLGLKARDILATFFNDEHAATRGALRGAMWTATIDAVQTILAAAAAYRSSK